MAYRGRIVLLNSTGLAATVTGETRELIRRRSKQFMGRLSLINDSGTTPTADGKIQTSPDGIVGWKDFLTFTQRTTSSGIITDTANIEDVQKDPNSGQPFPFFRGVVTLGGTDPVYDLVMELWFD